MTSSPLVRASEEFAGQLTRWREERGLTKRALATGMGFDPSYVSHIEAGRYRPTEDFARRAEAVLRAGGEIWASYTSYEALRQSAAPVAGAETGGWTAPGTGLVVEREQAALGLRDGVCHVRVRRHLYNAGADPVIRYPVRIRVDRDIPVQRGSARLAGEPLTVAELGFTAHHGDGDEMAWQVGHDGDAAKELWLRFENPDRRFPLYPRQRTTIEYGYRVGAAKWGNGFQRAIRLPTRDLEVELDFATRDEPSVWATVSSLSAEAAPLGPPTVLARDGGRTAFRWSVTAPLLQARYRLEWRLRSTVA
jgi:transcriptional regulator with XRE-family HTH domain